MEYIMPKIAQQLFQHLEDHSVHLPDTAALTVLELLYGAYVEARGRDPKIFDEGFRSLDARLEKLSLEENNAVFAVVCDLCTASEKRAFIDAIQLGAFLMLELQEK